MPDNFSAVAKISDAKRRNTRGKITALSRYTKGALSILDGTANRRDFVQINFPAMPDQVVLARRAVYESTSVFTTPDGWHQYSHTDPLKIPFSFRLHADDDYCVDGGLTLLSVAAGLHSLVLPISSGDSTIKVQYVAAPTSEKTGTESGQKGQTKVSDPWRWNHAVDPSDSAKIYYPSAVQLDLINAGDQFGVIPGVSCVGYIEDVSAILHGPFLQPQSSSGYNIPTWAEYSFTFVYRPSHTNAQPRNDQIVNDYQTYAGIVSNNLYNTAILLGAPPQFVGSTSPQPAAVQSAFNAGKSLKTRSELPASGPGSGVNPHIGSGPKGNPIQ